MTNQRNRAITAATNTARNLTAVINDTRLRLGQYHRAFLRAWQYQSCILYHYSDRYEPQVPDNSGLDPYEYYSLPRL